MTKKEETPGIKFNKQLWQPSQKEEPEKPIQFAKQFWDEKNKKAEKEDEPIKFQPQAWREIAGILNPIVLRQFDGINTMNPFAIKDTFATRNQNITTSKYPAITVRPGSKKIRDGLGNGTDVINGMSSYMGKELIILAGMAWCRYKNNVWEQLNATTFGYSTKITFTHFQGNFSTMCLLAANGKDKPIKYDGTNVVWLANAPEAGNYICTHDNRVYIAKGQTVHYSALRKAEDWTTVDDAGQIAIESSDGKDISGMIAGSSRLTVFKPNSIYELFGTRPGNFQLKTVTENLGCPAGHTIQVIDGVIFFLGTDGVYRYSGGNLPDKEFSIPIKDYFERINQTAVIESMSWTDDRRYYLALPIDGSDEPNIVLEYDLLYKTWNAWKLPYALNAKPTSINSQVYYGTVEGHVLQFDDTLAKDSEKLIEWEWVSKPFTFSSMAAKVRWYRLWVVAEVPSGSTMKIYLSDQAKGENWRLVKTATTNETVQTQEILIPVGFVSQSSQFRIRLEGTGPVTIHEITRQERVFPLV